MKAYDKAIDYLESLLLESEIKAYGRSLTESDYVARHFNLPLNKIAINNVMYSATKQEILEAIDLHYEKPPYQHQDPILYGIWKCRMDIIVRAAKKMLPNTCFAEQIKSIEDIAPPIVTSLENDEFNACIRFKNNKQEIIKPIVIFHSGLHRVADIFPRFFVDTVIPTKKAKQIKITLGNIANNLYNESVLIAFPFMMKYLFSKNNLYDLPYLFEAESYSNFNHIFSDCIMLFIVAHEFSHYLFTRYQLEYDPNVSADGLGLSKEAQLFYANAWKSEFQADFLAIGLTMQAAQDLGYNKNNICTGIIMSIIIIDILTKAQMFKAGIHDDDTVLLSNTHPPTEHRIINVARTLVKSYGYDIYLFAYVNATYKLLWTATKRHLYETDLACRESGLLYCNIVQYLDMLTKIVKMNINARNLFK